MRSLPELLVISSLLCPGGEAIAQAVGQFPFAVTREGQMLGAVEGEVASFRGLAFAAAPVSELRWRPPQATAENQEMRTAYEYGAPCLQPGLPDSREDCLTLNVFRPFGVDGPLPVLVFIHGGGFVSGSASDPLYDGARLARSGLIVVTVNYRLGAAGWLVDPALSGGFGNYGLMDQIAALRWIRDNIAAFGGDSGNVTLFGNGAGATSIALLMLSPPAGGLFHKAILQSIPARARLRSAQEAAAAGRDFIAALGPHADLRTVEPSRLLAAEDHVQEQSPHGFGPVFDGILVTEDIATGFAAGHESRIPIIVGSNDDETGFDGERDQSEPNLATRLRTDALFSEPVRLLARLHAATGAPTFRYRFGYVPEAVRADPGLGHGRELQFIFGAEGVPGTGLLSRSDREVGRRLRAYWANFARTGDPNGLGLPHWDSAATGDRLLLIDNDRLESADDPWSARLDRLAR